MPVAMVRLVGNVAAKSGSTRATWGAMTGWRTNNLRWVVGSVTIATKVTSEPVPAVVGTAINGNMPAGVVPPPK